MKKLSKQKSEHIQIRLGWLNPIFEEMWIRFEPMVFDKDAESVELEIHNNNFRIVANPKVWNKWSGEKQLFVICHEMCHVMFGHWLIDPKLNREWCNIAQDIQVNEFLFKTLGKNFITRELDDFATIETVFKDKWDLVKRNQDCKYYYNLLMKCL